MSDLSLDDIVEKFGDVVHRDGSHLQPTIDSCDAPDEKRDNFVRKTVLNVRKTILNVRKTVLNVRKPILNVRKTINNR